MQLHISCRLSHVEQLVCHPQGLHREKTKKLSNELDQKWLQSCGLDACALKSGQCCSPSSAMWAILQPICNLGAVAAHLQSVQCCSPSAMWALLQPIRNVGTSCSPFIMWALLQPICSVWALLQPICNVGTVAAHLQCGQCCSPSALRAVLQPICTYSPSLTAYRLAYSNYVDQHMYTICHIVTMLENF